MAHPPLNVRLLSNAQLGPRATITLNACQAGAGGPNSIAKLIANQLQRRVYAPVLGMYFSTDPNTKAPNGEGLPQVPDNPPVYMIQEYGNPLKQFCPGNLCQ